MRTSFLLTVSVCLFVQTLGLKTPHQQEFIKQVAPAKQGVGLDGCEICLQFMDQAINAVLQFIVQAGIGDTCQDLCQYVAQQTGSAALGDVCDILCLGVGLDEFVHILDRTDIDDILYCEDLRACPVNDHGDAKFTMFDVQPKSGPNGVFDLSFQYSSTNGTGTGQIALAVDTVDGLPVGQAFLHEIAGPGVYNGVFKLKAEKDPECDPSQGPCENWEPGTYTVKIAICNGECGSKHPHSQIYDEAQVQFVITKKD